MTERAIQRPHRPGARAMAGFSLIELLVVLAIAAVLVTLAYPSYVEHLNKGKRAEGRAALAELMLQQERYMTQRNSYRALDAGELGTSFKTWSGDSGLANAAYRLQAEDCGAHGDIRACVQLTAVPTFPDEAGAGNLMVNSLGNKSCSGSRPQVCW